MRFDEPKLSYSLSLASVPEARQVNRRKVVKRALKADPEADVPGGSSDSRNDDFLLVLFWLKRKE